MCDGLCMVAVQFIRAEHVVFGSYIWSHTLHLSHSSVLVGGVRQRRSCALEAGIDPVLVRDVRCPSQGLR